MLDLTTILIRNCHLEARLLLLLCDFPSFGPEDIVSLILIRLRNQLFLGRLTSPIRLTC